MGTVAMDLLWFYRYRRGGGGGDFADWEFSTGLSSWDDAPAPGQIGKRVLETVFQREIPPERAALVSDVMHWFYGLFWGAQYGIVAGSLPARGWLPSGIAFGSLVWAGDYVVLPLANVYKPIWEYDTKTLLDDLSAHLVFGLGTSTTFLALSSR